MDIIATLQGNECSGDGWLRSILKMPEEAFGNS